MFHTCYYNEFPHPSIDYNCINHDHTYDLVFGRRCSDFSLIASHICAEKNQKFSRPVEDFRFNECVEYKGIGNSRWMRVNACASLRLNLWCIKPSTQWQYKIIQYFVSITVKPFASLADFGINAIFVPLKVGIFAAAFFIKVIHKMYNPQVNIELSNTAYYSYMNIFSQLGAAGKSGMYFSYQVIAALSLNFLGPKCDPFLRWNEGFNWAYWVNDDQLILDANRVKYIKEKCDWQDVPNDVFKTICKPWLWLQQYEISCSEIKGGYKFFMKSRYN